MEVRCMKCGGPTGTAFNCLSGCLAEVNALCGVCGHYSCVCAETKESGTDAAAAAATAGAPNGTPRPKADLVKRLEKVGPFLSRNYCALVYEAAGEIERLRAACQWKPIETAPKDGTEVLLAAIGQTFKGQPMSDRVTIGHWTTEEECRAQIGDCGGECRCPEYSYQNPMWISWDGGFTEENPPTHWMPLPKPPAAIEVADRQARSAVAPDPVSKE